MEIGGFDSERSRLISSEVFEIQLIDMTKFRFLLFTLLKVFLLAKVDIVAASLAFLVLLKVSSKSFCFSKFQQRLMVLIALSPLWYP
jgi:hypothetical protein